jgi:hypothetical protein
MGRTTIILGIITAIMAAFILFFERGTITSRDVEKRKGHLIQWFIRDRIKKVEIERGGQKTVLVKVPVNADDPETEIWKFSQPWSAEADDSAIDSILGALEWLDSKRVLDKISNEDKKQFGFEKPKLRAWFSVGSKRMPIVVGNQDPRGSGYYLQLDDPAKAYIVEKEILEALDHEAGFFYTKKLHDGVSIYTTASIVVRDENGENAVEKRKSDFWLTRPVSALASYDAVDGLISAIDNMKATRFVSDRSDDLARFGLEAPILEAVIRSTTLKEEGKKESEKPPLQIRIGAKCQDREKESYVLVGEHKPVMCVSDESLTAIRKAVDTLRDKQLLPLKESDIEAVRIESGTKRLELDLNKEKWSYKALNGKDVVAKGEADASDVERWLGELKAVGIKASTPANEKTLKEKGISKPRTVVRFIRSKKDEEIVIRLGATERDELFAQRADEPWISTFPASAFDLLTPTSAHVRKLKLMEEKSEELVELSIKRSGTTEKLVKSDKNSWEIQQPIKIEADSVIANELGQLFSKLEALRFVADAPEPEHGLDSPAIVVTASYSKPATDVSDKKKVGDAKEAAPKARTYTLKIGNAGDKGHFAQLGEDRAVFVIGQNLMDQVSEPLVSRSLLSTPKERIQNVRIEKGDKAVEIERQGNGFRFVDGKGSDADAGLLVDRITDLKASKITGYGEPLPQEGMEPARFRIIVTRNPDAPEPHSYQLLIGNVVTKDEKAPQLFVRRSDLQVGFAVLSDQIENLIKRVR